MNNASWFDSIRIYHLLIDRFNGGWQTPPKSENVFCGGNLQGVINKLDYIKVPSCSHPSSRRQTTMVTTP